MAITEEMATQHFPMVHKIARKLIRHVRDKAVDYDDLFSEGCIALIKALESFDPSKGFAFSTFAFKTIEGSLRSFLDRKCSAIRFPPYYVTLAHKIWQHQLMHESPETIAEKLKCEVSYAKYALKYIKLSIPVELDKPREGGDREEDYDDHSHMAVSFDDLSVAESREFIRNLNPKKRRILELRIQGYNGHEIARMFGLTHQAIFQQMQSIKRIYERYELISAGGRAHELVRVLADRLQKK